MNNIEDKQVFLNLQTDFLFKRVFGSPKNRKTVIRFLEAVLGENYHINRIEFQDKEMLPPDENGKRIVYDIFCTTDVIKDNPEPEFAFETTNGEYHFIVEMQNAYEPPYEDRILTYTAAAIASQAKRGGDYTLKPVITIVVADFDMKNLQPKLIREMVVADRESSEILSDKMRIFLLSLQQIIDMEWDDCDTEIKRILYLIKNMEGLDKDSPAYKCGEYMDIFNTAERANLAAEDIVPYSQSLTRLKDMQRGFEYAYDEGMAKGIAEGEAKGKAEGKAEVALELARQGMGIDFIANIVKMSTDQVRKILDKVL